MLEADELDTRIDERITGDLEARCRDLNPETCCAHTQHHAIACVQMHQKHECLMLRPACKSLQILSVRRSWPAAFAEKVLLSCCVILTLHLNGLLCAVQFLDGTTLRAIMSLNKIVRKMVAEESHIYTVSNPRFIHGEGYKSLV